MADTYGAVEGAETPLATFQAGADAAPATRSRSRTAFIVAGMMVVGAAATVGARAYSGSTTGAAQMAAVEPEVEALAASEEAEVESAVVIGSWQREALRSVLKKVGYTQNIIFGHENSNREGQYFWDNAGMDAHSDVFNTTGQ